MGYVFAVAAGLIGGIAALALIERRQYRKRRHARSRAAQTVKEEKGTDRKIEFSKLVLSAVLLTYFAGFGLGFWAVLIDLSQLFVESKGGKRREDQKGEPVRNRGVAR